MPTTKKSSQPGRPTTLEPGHLPIMEEDCEMVEFSPKELSRKMLMVAAQNMMKP